MARKTKVRSDDRGLFVRADGRVFRPGHVTGLPRANMTDGGLRAGDEVRAGHVSGTTRCRVTTAGGAELVWHNDYQHQREAERAAELAAMRAAGIDPAAALRAVIRPAEVANPHGADGEDPPVPGGGPRR